MAHTTLVLVFFLLLPELNALQATSVQKDVRVHHNNISQTFVSANTLWCGQALSPIGADALNLYKSMPRGKLYDGVSLNLEKNCEQLGYHVDKGEDPCYPGLRTFYHNEEEQHEFLTELQSTLREYGQYAVNIDDANLMDSCKCKDSSYAKQFFGGSCKRADQLQAMVNRNPFRTFVSANKMFCAQARKDAASTALNLYKSMPRAKLFEGILLSDTTSCKKLGYHWNTGEDPCFPELQTFYRSDEEQQKFMNEFQRTLKEYSEIHNFTLEDANLIDTCSCKDGSFAKNFGGSSCGKAAELEKLA